MGSLDAGGGDISAWVHFDPQKMPARATIAHHLGQNARMGRKRNVAKALPPQYGRTHQQQKSNECRNRITRQTEQELSSITSKYEWSPGFDGHTPELQFAPRRFESALDEVKFSNRNTARGDDSIAFVQRLFQRGSNGIRDIRDERKDSRDATGAREQRRQS